MPIPAPQNCLPEIGRHALAYSTPAFCYPTGIDIAACPGLIVDIGPGRGDFLFHLAASHPESTVVGIELKRRRIDKLMARQGQRALPNIVLIHGDAKDVMGTIFRPGQVATIFINFPDPWPKRRHGHHRLMTPSFVQACARALTPDGMLCMTTDAAEYAAHTMKLMEQNTGFRPLQQPAIATECPDAYPTAFAQKWSSAGRPIYYQKYRRIGEEAMRSDPFFEKVRA